MKSKKDEKDLSSLRSFFQKNKKNICITILFLATIFRILLAITIPFQILYAPHDDTLLFNVSQNLREGHWLGPYTDLTLAKNTTFPILLAFCNYLMIPYSLALISIFILSIILFCIALKPKFSKKSLCILYLLLLFTPFMFVELLTQRLYRNSLLPSGSLLVFASFIGLYLRRSEPTKKLIPWCVIGSLSLIFFWYIKEDSIWILPFICTISVLCIFNWLKNPRKILLVIIPFLVLLGVNTIYKTINYDNYGIYTISDRSSGNFAKMSKSLLSIQDNNKNDPRIWISKTMLEKAFAVSPTFSELKKPLENSSAWTDPNGEVRGDWIIWKIRTVMSENGYYENATKADEFCGKVHEELEDAYKNKSLEKDDSFHISSMMRGIKSEDIGETLTTQFNWYNALSVYSATGVANRAGTANTEYTIEVQSFTNSAVAFPNTNYPNKAVNYANIIVKLYQKTAIVINIVSTISFILMLIVIIRQLIHKNTANIDMALIVIGIGLTIILVLSEISLFAHAFLGDEIVGNPLDIFYCAPILILIDCFKYIPILFVFNYFYPRRKKLIIKLLKKHPK